MNTAEKIASFSRIAVKAGKEVVNKSQELGIREGLEYERRVFHSLFGSKDQKIGMHCAFSIEFTVNHANTNIGMTAFAEKKMAEWTNS